MTLLMRMMLLEMAGEQEPEQEQEVVLKHDELFRYLDDMLKQVRESHLHPTAHLLFLGFSNPPFIPCFLLVASPPTSLQIEAGTGEPDLELRETISSLRKETTRTPTVDKRLGDVSLSSFLPPNLSLLSSNESLFPSPSSFSLFQNFLTDSLFPKMFRNMDDKWKNIVPRYVLISSSLFSIFREDLC
jgi:hypothetical protein